MNKKVMQQAENKTDWRDTTTFIKRFGDAMQALCKGRRPADEMMTAWFDFEADDLRLQHFACEHGPSWAQGIGVIDAATVLADQPTEGVKHEYRAQPVQPTKRVQAVGCVAKDGCTILYFNNSSPLPFQTDLYTTPQPAPQNLQKRLADLHLYEEIAEHYAKCAVSPEALRDWVAERTNSKSAVKKAKP